MSVGPLRRARRLVQVGTVLAFIAIPLLNLQENYFFVGNMLAFNAGTVPLADPLAMLQVMAATVSANSSMLMGAGLSLLLAAILGPVFCSWLCPFGFLSELAHSGNRKQSTPAAQAAVSFRPFLARLGIACAGILIVLTVLPMPILTQVSMPGWFTRFWQSAITHRDFLWPALVIVPGILLVEAVAGKRIWCRYVCPQSVLISLAGLIFPNRLSVRFTRQACTCSTHDQVCRKACSLDLNPRDSCLAQKAQCTNCGDCIDACRSRGRALGFGVAPKAPPSRHDAASRTNARGQRREDVSVKLSRW